MGAIPLKVRELQLDLENPRLENASGQREALIQMVLHQKDKLAELAEDIVEAGMLSPIDRILVLSDGDGKFIVLEGNRRIAALKILANPSVLSDAKVDTKLRKRFEALSKRFKVATVEPIDAFQIATRLEGNRWIYLRHAGEQAGRGIVRWDGIATARFRGGDPALQALEFVRVNGNLDDDDLLLLDQSFPITNLDRLLRNPDVRTITGLVLKGNELLASAAAAEIIKPLRRIVLDLAHREVNVSRIKNKTQQLDYVRGFPVADQASLKNPVEPTPIESISVNEPKSAKKHKRKKSTVGRQTISPSRLDLDIADDRIAGIFNELRSLRADKYPNAGAVLIRVFLEMSVDTYLIKNGVEIDETDRGGHKKDKPLSQKVKEAVAMLLAQGVGKEKDYFSVKDGIDRKTSPLFAGLLNAYVHNKYVTPKGGDLITAWSDAQPFFERLWA